MISTKQETQSAKNNKGLIFLYYFSFKLNKKKLKV